VKKLRHIEELLIVIDMINGFVREGNMKDEYIEHIVPGVESLVKEYVGNNNSEVFYIKDAHNDNAIEFTKFPVHCIEGTSESEVLKELKPYEEKVRSYTKNSTSVMFAKGFIKDINKMKNLKRVVFVGCCSDICVLNSAIPLINYFDEKNMNIVVEVRSDLVETYHSDIHDRDKYNNLSLGLLKQAGALITKKRGEEKC